LASYNFAGIGIGQIGLDTFLEGVFKPEILNSWFNFYRSLR
jgi:hypothetical protein